MEKILMQIAIISYFSRLIIKLAFACHQIVFPLSFITAASRILVLSPSFSLSIQFKPLVLTSIFYLLDYVQKLTLAKFKRLNLFLLFFLDYCRGVDLQLVFLIWRVILRTIFYYWIVYISLYILNDV